MARMRKNQGGFTLLEMLAVIFIMAMIVGISIPNLWPSIAFAGLDGEAKYIANYGREAVAHCTLMRERVVVKIDFEEQRIWAERMPSPASFIDQNEIAKTPEEEFDPYAPIDESVNPIERAEQLRAHTDAFKRESIEILAQNIEQSALGLSDVGVEFQELEFDDDEEDKIVNDPLLAGHNMPETVRFSSVIFGGEETSTGIAEIEISPLGLPSDVTIYLLNTESDEMYTITWDSITGGARATAGEERPDAEAS